MPKFRATDPISSVGTIEAMDTLLELVPLLLLPLGAAWLALRDGAPTTRRLSMLLVGLLAASAGLLHEGLQVEAAAEHLPRDRAGDQGYVSSSACQACHPGSHASWSTTFHRTMTQRVSPETVLAEWSGNLEHAGHRYVLRRDGDRFLIDMPRPGTLGQTPADRVEREVVMSTGSHHQQLYWYVAPWADHPPAPRGLELFAARCAGCHGAEGEGVQQGDGGGFGPRLRAQEDTPGDVLEALKGEAHASVGPLSGDDRYALLDRVERIETSNRLMQFPFAWLTRDARWVHEEYTFLDPPEDQTDPNAEVTEVGPEPYEQGWSNACDSCHSVNPAFVDPGLGPGRAYVADLGIACESCHGPGAKHVARHRAPWNRYGEKGTGDIVVPNQLPPHLSASVCGVCHGDLVDRGDAPDRRFLPGDRLEDWNWVVQRDLSQFPSEVQEAILDDDERIEGGYWDDGTVRVVGRDYNGLALTPCHTAGEMDCTTCHSMHDAAPSDQLKPEAVQGDAMCSSCHGSEAADPNHSHHSPAADGGPSCYDCHMPRTTWGLLGAIRAHRVDQPDAAKLWGNRPHACTLCHLELTRDETSEALSDWYGQPAPRAPAVPPVTEGRSALLDLALRGDAAQRGVAVVSLGRESTRRSSGLPSAVVARVLAELLIDPYTAVRYAAIHALAELPGYEDLGGEDYLGPEAPRRTARRRVIARASAAVKDLADDPRVFLRGGAFEDAAIDEMLELRDDRPVSVNE